MPPPSGKGFRNGGRSSADEDSAGVVGRPDCPKMRKELFFRYAAALGLDAKRGVPKLVRFKVTGSVECATPRIGGRQNSR